MAPRLKHTRRMSPYRRKRATELKTWLAAQAVRLNTTVVAIIGKLNQPSVSSGNVGVLAGTFPKNTVAPAITGTPTNGQVLTTTDGTWTGTATITYSRRWRANGQVIAGATAATYTLTAAEVGKTITVEVFASNTLSGQAISALSNAVGPVA